MPTNTWTNGGGNRLWATATNWSLGRAPITNDDVVIAGALPPTTGPASALTLHSLDTTGVTVPFDASTTDPPVTSTIIIASGGTLNFGNSTTGVTSNYWSGDASLAASCSVHNAMLTNNLGIIGIVNNATLHTGSALYGGKAMGTTLFTDDSFCCGGVLQGAATWSSSSVQGISNICQDLDLSGAQITATTNLVIDLSDADSQGDTAVLGRTFSVAATGGASVLLKLTSAYSFYLTPTSGGSGASISDMRTAFGPGPYGPIDDEATFIDDMATRLLSDPTKKIQVTDSGVVVDGGNVDTVNNPVQTVGASGDGTQPVDQTTIATDAQNMLVEVNGSPAGGVVIKAYRASDWDTVPRPAPLSIKGRTVSLDDGTWESALLLTSSVQYIINFEMPDVSVQRRVIVP